MSKKSSSKAHSSLPRGRMRNAPLAAQRRAISRRNRPSLSIFRQVTHSPKQRISTLPKRVSYQEVFRGFLDNFLSSVSLKPSVCARRKERRQVLFAKNLTGKGSRAKHHKMTADSKVRCS